MKWRCRYCKRPAQKDRSLIACYREGCSWSCDSPAAHNAVSDQCAFEPNLSLSSPLERLAGICKELGIAC